MKTISIAWAALALLLSACQAEPAGEFALYLLADEHINGIEAAGQRLEDLVLQDTPVLSSADILWYDLNTHTLEVTGAAYRRVQGLFTLPVRVDGLPFVVTVGEERIYIGAFWTPLSSLSFDGVVIMQPFSEDEQILRIDLGYPGPDFSNIEDPRGRPQIIAALDAAGKLKE